MLYNSSTRYTGADFKNLLPGELQILFESARKVVLEVHGLKLIQKVSKDIRTMRRLLHGFDSTYNRKHQCLKSSR